MKNLKLRALRAQKLCIWERPALHVWRFSLQADPCRCWWCPVTTAEITIRINNPGASPHLISGIGLKEGIELVHLPDVGPQVHETRGDLEVREESSWLEYLVSFGKFWREVGGGRAGWSRHDRWQDWAQPSQCGGHLPSHHWLTDWLTGTDWFSLHLQLGCAEALASTRNQSNTLCPQ